MLCRRGLIVYDRRGHPVWAHFCLCSQTAVAALHAGHRPRRARPRRRAAPVPAVAPARPCRRARPSAVVVPAPARPHRAPHRHRPPAPAAPTTADTATLRADVAPKRLPERRRCLRPPPRAPPLRPSAASTPDRLSEATTTPT
jgi:hypothetical protein